MILREWNKKYSELFLSMPMHKGGSPVITLLTRTLAWFRFLPPTLGFSVGRVPGTHLRVAGLPHSQQTCLRNQCFILMCSFLRFWAPQFNQAAETSLRNIFSATEVHFSKLKPDCVFVCWGKLEVERPKYKWYCSRNCLGMEAVLLRFSCCT